MGEENVNVLVKSEKISQKKKKRIVWAVSVLLVIVTLIAFAVDYSGYKKGQEYGLASASITSTISGSSWVNKNDSYAEQCREVYNKLNRKYYDIVFDMSAMREAQRALKESFTDVMQSAGFDRYNRYNIEDWFKYTNIAEYFIYYYWNHVLPIISYIALLFSSIFTVLINLEAKKELVVYENSVLCRVNPKKSKHLVFEDINSVDFGKNTLKIVGTGVRFKISNLTNAESIKSVIIEKKKTAQTESDKSNSGNAEELKKYKELLDSGIITQEEFDAKKKQILGL